MASRTRSTSARRGGSAARGKAKDRSTGTTRPTKTTGSKAPAKRRSGTTPATAPTAKRAGSTTAARAAAPAPNKYFELRSSAIQGRGAFATRPIKRGTRIIEYTGQRISPDEADQRYDDPGMGRHHTFLFSIDRSTVIDAAVDGNEARFINHSCAPNCEAIDERKRIYIEAIRDIPVGEELTYDYAYERDGTEDEDWERLYVCKCGAPTCRGTILAPPKKRGKKK
jgi:hypothetical protein